jgi:hypothetical protein
LSDPPPQEASSSRPVKVRADRNLRCIVKLLE